MGILHGRLQKEPHRGTVWLAISSAFDNVGRTISFYKPCCVPGMTTYDEYKLTCSGHIYFKVHDSSFFFFLIIFLALDEEIKIHLFSCFTALCLFTVRIYLEHTQVKDTLERDLGSAALQYFSSLVLLKN